MTQPLSQILARIEATRQKAKGLKKTAVTRSVIGLRRFQQK